MSKNSVLANHHAYLMIASLAHDCTHLLRFCSFPGSLSGMKRVLILLLSHEIYSKGCKFCKINYLFHDYLNDTLMSYYQHHVFFCINQREGGAKCCNDLGAQALRDYAKQRIKSLKLDGKNRIRINNAGCLDRCNEGPVIVVYPDETWYTYIDKDDIDEIIDEHLVKGNIVERLKI